MDKVAISVTTTLEPETSFIAGMPQSPAGPIQRGSEVLALQRRFPKAMSMKGDAGISDAFASGASEMVDRLQRKIGSVDFIAGFLYEIEKGAAHRAGPHTGIRKPVVEKLKVRLSAVRPQLTRMRPMPHEELAAVRRASPAS